MLNGSVDTVVLYPPDSTDNITGSAIAQVYVINLLIAIFGPQRWPSIN